MKQSTQTNTLSLSLFTVKQPDETEHTDKHTKHREKEQQPDLHSFTLLPKCSLPELALIKSSPV
jgi:hypothetical protein